MKWNNLQKPFFKANTFQLNAPLHIELLNFKQRFVRKFVRCMARWCHNFIQQSHNSDSRGVSEIRDGEDLWQWSPLEIKLNTFRQSTITQKQFIIIIIILENIEMKVSPGFLCKTSTRIPRTSPILFFVYFYFQNTKNWGVKQDPNRGIRTTNVNNLSTFNKY